MNTIDIVTAAEANAVIASGDDVSKIMLLGRLRAQSKKADADFYAGRGAIQKEMRRLSSLSEDRLRAPGALDEMHRLRDQQNILSANYNACLLMEAQLEESLGLKQ